MSVRICRRRRRHHWTINIRLNVLRIVHKCVSSLKMLCFACVLCSVFCVCMYSGMQKDILGAKMMMTKWCVHAQNCLEQTKIIDHIYYMLKSLETLADKLSGRGGRSLRA